MMPERDVVMIVANMVEAALAGGGADEHRQQDHRHPSGAAGGSVCAPVDYCPGARAHRINCAPIRAGRGGGAAWMERRANLGNRCRICGPFNQYPERGQLGLVVSMAMSRLGPAGAKAAALWTLRALAPGNSAPRLRRQCCSQLAQGQRLSA